MGNLAQSVWSWSVTQPDRLAVVSSDTRFTYRQLHHAIDCAAGYLTGLGIESGNRVVLVAPSVPEFAVAYYGLLAVGATVVSMNTMSTPAEISYVLGDTGAQVLVVWHDSADAATSAAEDAGARVVILEQGAEFDAEPVLELQNFDFDHPALMLYTSGTTGRPKGAEISVGAVEANARAVTEAFGLTRDDRLGTALPLFHVFGQVTVMNSVLTVGATLSVAPKFDPAEMIEMIRTENLSGIAGVPTMWNAMLHASAQYTAADFGTLRLAVSGAAALPAAVIDAFEARFGCPILEGYALTETTGAATFNYVAREKKTGTVGQPLSGFEIEIRADGDALPAGEIGEIFVKGPTTMTRYHNLPDATAVVLSDGWLDTGDLGRVDPDGYLSIVDRTKDLIIRGGYNVYPREIEDVLYRHPRVVEVAVVGVPDDSYGEEVAAVVVAEPGNAPTIEELRSWAKRELSAYKVPHLFHFVSGLPKGPTGKISKRHIDRSLTLFARESAQR